MNRLFFITLLTLTALRSGAQNLASSLTACYALDGNASEPINNLTGTLSSVSATLGHLSTANTGVHFLGQNTSFIQLPNNSLLKPNQITFSGWIKTDNFSPTQTFIFAKNTSPTFFVSYAMNIISVGSVYKFEIGIQNGSGSDLVHSTTTVSTNTWYHVAFCMDNTTMRLFVNGVLENSMTPTIANFNYDPTRNVILGGTNESVNYPFNGTLDNVRFYNRILSPQEINALYTQDPFCVEDVTGLSEDTRTDLDPFVFPNPVKHSFEIAGIKGAEYSVSIIDPLGKEVIAARVQEQDHTFNVSDLPTGIYFVRIKNGNEQKVVKLLKE